MATSVIGWFLWPSWPFLVFDTPLGIFRHVVGILNVFIIIIIIIVIS